MTRNSTRLSMLVAAIVIFWSTLPTPALADTVSFVARRAYEAGQSPVSVVGDDFNGDGGPDLAVADFDSNAVVVLLGNGDATFQAPLTVASATGPRSIVVGDFNGDGKTDLAVANFGSNTVSVLLGNGDGTFQAPFYVASGTGHRSVSVGGVNVDGTAGLG